MERQELWRAESRIRTGVPASRRSVSVQRSAIRWRYAKTSFSNREAASSVPEMSPLMARSRAATPSARLSMSATASADASCDVCAAAVPSSIAPTQRIAAMRRVPAAMKSIRAALRLSVRFGPDRGGDVRADLRERATVGGGEGIEAGTVDRLARDRPPRAGPGRPLLHGPDRVHQHALARDGFEALDVDRDPVRGREARRERPARDVRGPEEHAQVSRDRAGDVVVQR